jgi:hypothetical protein
LIRERASDAKRRLEMLYFERDTALKSENAASPQMNFPEEFPLLKKRLLIS